MKLKRITALLLSVLLLTSLGTGTLAVGNTVNGDGNTIVFLDVPKTHWAYNEIQYFASQGIVNGTGNDTFAPADNVSRESFVKMMVLTFNAPLESPATPTFTDVKPDRWSYPYVEVSRDFLTGYASPYDGTMTFRPEAIATREDIAVALVRMMGLTEKDAQNSNAYKKFSDYETISPGLQGYVSVATEKGLINGIPGAYGEVSFGAQNPISRAETVVLLSRASKSTVTGATAALEVETNLTYSSDGKTATVHITAPEGSTVTADEQAIKMTSSWEGYEGAVSHAFAEEGTHVFRITVKKGGKVKKLDVTAKYAVDAPVLNITSCPTKVSKKDITISGKLTDQRNDVSLTINGESVTVGSYSYNKGEWSKGFTLTEGKNEFVFVGTNAAGKTVTETRVVVFDVSGPTLTISSCPTKVKEKNITISGKLTDANYDVSLTINGESVTVGSYSYNKGEWSKGFTLVEGENKFTFVGTSTAGKTITEERTVVFDLGGPTLTITSCPIKVTEKNVTIGGKLTDTNYGVSLTINGESVSVGDYSYNKGEWSKSFTLIEGENKFVLVGSNAVGKTVTAERTILFEVGGPKLTVTSCPTKVSEKSVTISGKLTDTNYSVALTINGESVPVGDYSYNKGEWSKTFTLIEGENKFAIVGTNAGGKTITEERTITFEVPGPRITFTQCPSAVSVNTITIMGKLNDANYSVALTANGESVLVGDYSYNRGEWSKTFTLVPGVNTFTFVATNDGGKATTVVKTVTYTPVGAPPADPVPTPPTEPVA